MGLRLRGSDKSNADIDRIAILKDVTIFSESDDRILKRLSSFLTDIFIAQDEAVFHKGDELNAMYIIAKGKVKVHDGNHIFTEFNDRDFFGEYSLIDSSVRSATVTAIEDTHLLRLDQEDFHKIIEDNVEVSKAVLKSLIRRLRNNNVLEERLTQNSLKIQRQRDKLDKQKKELEELNATKDKFFTIIAHDLKNPFNTVIGLTELLIDRFDSYNTEKIQEFIQQIHTFSNNAYNLLEDLLQWAKSQTGRIDVNPDKVDIFELAMENKSYFEEKADEKGVRIDVKVPLQTYAFIDKNMITTVLRNLLSNAVKFTNAGDQITIKTNINNNLIEVSVKDTGIGIPKNNLEYIFKIDSNISTQGTADEYGTGLGLIISKEFVEKNEGTIVVNSKEGIGTEFIFTIPLYKD